MSSNDQQPSFKTNVNRMKTKRWVEAKSYSYDGDDWGDADEYDEYDGYNDEPESAPGPAAHAGSSRQPSGGYGQEPRQQMAPFPGAPPQPAYMQSQPRSGSPGRPPYAQDPRDRSGSFDRGEERRNFSGPPAPGSPTVAPLRTAYGAALRNQSPMGRGPKRVPTYPIEGQVGSPIGRSSTDQQLPPPGAPFAGGENSGRTWSMGSQGSIPSGQRRDYPSLGAQRAQQPQTSGRPPRKESLGQANAPDPSFLQQNMASQGPGGREAGGEHSFESSALQETQSPVPKIIRPADIYKRVAEEKERERMSQESGRPSLSDIMRENYPDPIPETQSAALRSRKATLDTVAERKSEYGMEGLPNQGPTSAQNRSMAAANMTEEQRKRFSTSPQLPQFSSGFGDDWASAFGTGANDGQTNSTQPQETRGGLPAAGSGLGLTHKPSDGFTSVVHQAFDEPVSAVSANTSVDRSDTTSTNAISPIISRNPSKEQDKNKASELRAVNMGAIAEEGNIGAPHQDGVPSAVKQIDGKAQPSDDLPPPGFVPGHRRNTSIPSPGNSPARQPKLEVVNTPQNVQEAAQAQRAEQSASRRRAESEVKAAQIQSVVESLAQKNRESPLISPTRAESPSKGRVRDLVDKAESASSSRRGSDASQTGGLRPAQERADSFRPQLPGGWNSYVTNPASPSPERGVSPLRVSRPSSQAGLSNLSGASVNPSLVGKGDGTPAKASEIPDTATEGIDIEPTTRKRSLAQDETTASSDPSQNPLTAAKTAGAALAGAVTAAVGLGTDQSASRGQREGYENGANTFYPESSRPLMPPSVDSNATSILPSSRSYTPTRASEEPSEEDIPAVAPLRQRGPGAPASPVMGNTFPAGSTAASTPRAPFVSAGSPQSPLEDNDRLRDDIVRQLTPIVPAPEASMSHPSTPIPPQATSTAQPASLQNPAASPTSGSNTVATAKAKTLKHKFSWEADSESEEEVPEAPALQPSKAPATAGTKAIVPPTQTITTVRSEPISELDSGPPSFQHNFMVPATPAAQEEKTQLNELPAIRMSSDAEEPEQIPELSVSTSKAAGKTGVDPLITSPHPPQVPSKNNVSPMSPSEDSPTIEQQQFQPPSQGARQRGQTLTNSQVPIPAFREILAIKSPEERLRVYRSTQETFYNMNTGLSSWIHTMGERHPEHKTLLQTAGNFSTPTPGLPTPPRPQQAGASSVSGSGTGLSGLRKAGAAAAPTMNDAGAVLKSAGRDTKKLAKGLFAKGRSKFGRDKGSSKLAAISSPPQKYQPYRPDANANSSSPQVSAPYAPYRPGQPPPPPVNLAPSVGKGPAAPAPVLSIKTSDVSNKALQEAPKEVPQQGPQHTPNQKSSPDLPAFQRPRSAAPRPSDVSDMTYYSTGSGQHGFIPIGLSPDIESPPVQIPDVKPILTQRLTIHQKDIKPFEASFPSDLLRNDAYKDHTKNEASPPPILAIPLQGKPGTPTEEEAVPDQSTPIQGHFPKRTQSLAAGKRLTNRTLDPGVESFNTTPSWLNFDPQSSPASSDLLSPKSNKSSPADTAKSKRSSLQIPLRVQSSKALKPIEEPVDEDNDKTPIKAGNEDRPFSFINFASRPETDFSLDEQAYRVPSRESSVFTSSTEDYDPSRPSTHEDSLRHEVSHDEYSGEEDEGAKPLPQLPQEAANIHKTAMGPAMALVPGAINHYATMPARKTPKVSLFPQASSSRPGTREREIDNSSGDFGPPRLQHRPQEASASMPVTGSKQRRHKRGLSGGNLLQRALTAGMNTLESTLEAPRRDKSVVKAEKTDKKKRRFSGLNLLGKPKMQTRRVPIDDPTPPGTSQLRNAEFGGANDGGIAGLANNTALFEQRPQQSQPHLPDEPGRSHMQRPNVPDSIHVAPIKGYYSPEGDATSPLPQSHIAAQLHGKSPRSPPSSKPTTSPEYDPSMKMAHAAGQSTSPTSRNQQSSPSPRAPNVPPSNFQSAFNESNHALRHAQGQMFQSEPASRTPSQQRIQPSPQSKQHSPPLYSPPRSQLPQLPMQASAHFPQVTHTLQREATLRNAPESPAQPVNHEQLVPAPLSVAGTASNGSTPEPQLDRRSLDAFPRPPSKSSQTSRSPNSRSPSGQWGFLNTKQGSHSPSASISTARRSRGPSLSVDTNLANNGRASRVSGNSTMNGNGASQQAGAKPDAKRNDDEEENEEEDELPSGLSALQNFEQVPPSAHRQTQTNAQSSVQAKPLNIGAAAAPAAAPATKAAATDIPTASTVTSTEASTEPEAGAARKTAIQPAALRRMRQREIELGGETRLNSPLALGSVMKPMPILKVDIKSATASPTSAPVTGSGSAKIVASPKVAVTQEFGTAEAEEEDASDDEKEVVESVHLTVADVPDEDRILMSATSGPGQEWNPYEQAWM